MNTRKPVCTKYIFLSTGFLTLGLLLGCNSVSSYFSASTLTPAPPTDFSFDPSVNIVVLYADFRSQAEPPLEHEVCQYDSIPMLRIWGDGLTFFDLESSPDEGPQRWQGHLDQNQWQNLLDYLDENAFFGPQIEFTTRWEPLEPYVPKTWYQMGANFTNQSVVFESPTVDLFWHEFKTHLQSFLSPLEINELTDPRIRNLNIGTRVCTTPTPE